MNFIKRNILIISLMLAGALAGFLYWKYIGCLTGTCPIKSRWYLMIIYGTIVGYLAGSLAGDVKNFLKKRRELKERVRDDKNDA